MKYSPYDNTQSILIVRINLSLNYIINRIDSFCCFIYQNDNEDALEILYKDFGKRDIYIYVERISVYKWSNFYLRAIPCSKCSSYMYQCD